jgi:AAA domain-containing protein
VGAEGKVGSGSTRLVVIRGESGSGKSSVAAGLRVARPEGTLAVVSQDQLRRDVLGGGASSHDPAVGLIDLTVRHALDHGFDVVLEGILGASRHGEMLRQLVIDHRGRTRCYLYDLTFEETLRRHRGRPQAADFGETEMRAWWSGFQPVPGLDEAVFDADMTLAATVARILEDSWPAATRDHRATAPGSWADP